jgi:hypothetical protein
LRAATGWQRDARHGRQELGPEARTVHPSRGSGRARDADAALRARDPHAAAAQRQRGSGRKDIVREDRDTTSYRMVTDHARIRTLAARGASAESLADVLGLPIDEVRQVLADVG